MNYYNSETLLEQQTEIEKLKAERDALAATVEALRSDIEYVKGKLYILKAGVYVKRDTEKAHARCESALAATPQQHLAQIRVEAVESIIIDAYDAGHLNDFGGGNVGWWQDYIRSELAAACDFYQSQIDQYAEQIRQGEVE